MNLRKRRERTTEVYTSSLNDIMFFLLLFFLITSTLATPNVLKLLLPNSKASTQSIKHPITVSVTSDLQYAVNNTPVSPSLIEETLRAIIKDQTDPTALLKVDKSVEVQNLVDLLDIGNRLKIKMVLATSTSGNTKPVTSER